MFAKYKFDHLLVVHIAINNCDQRYANANTCRLMLVARRTFVINKHHWLRLTVSRVSVVLIVSTGSCSQGAQSSNPHWWIEGHKEITTFFFCSISTWLFTFFINSFFFNKINSTHSLHAIQICKRISHLTVLSLTIVT